MSFYRDQLEDWLKTLQVSADLLLDIGGAANPVKGRVKSFNVEDYLILDKGIEPEKGGYIRFDLNKPAKKNIIYPKEKRADIVFCLEVFEYIYDPVTALENIYHFLKDDGTAYISFPFVYPIHNPQHYDYLRYTPMWVIKMSKQIGFKDCENVLYRKDRSGKLQEFYKADGMHPAKGWDHSMTGFVVKLTK